MSCMAWEGLYVFYVLFYNYHTNEVAVCFLGGQGSAGMSYRPVLAHFSHWNQENLLLIIPQHCFVLGPDVLLNNDGRW